MSLFLNFELKTSIFKPVPHWLKKNSQPQQSALSIWKLKVWKKPFTIHFHIKAFWIAVVFHTTKLLLGTLPFSTFIAVGFARCRKNKEKLDFLIAWWIGKVEERKKFFFFATPSAMTKRSKLFLLFFCRLEHFPVNFKITNPLEKKL